MRTCNYRNCNNEIIGRPNKKFCCIQCKGNEHKYIQREKNNQIKNGK